MALVSKGEPIAVASDIDYHEDVDTLVRTETVVEHIKETTSDLTVSGSIVAEISEVDELYADQAVLATVTAQEVDTEDLAVNTLVAGAAEVLGHSTLGTVYADGLLQARDLKGETLDVTTGALSLDGTDYFVSNKYLPLDPSNPQGASEEKFQSDNTIVSRTRANGVRIDNLQVRGRSSGYADPYPGLFFTDGTCSDKFTIVHDGRIEFKRNAGETTDVLRFYADPGDTNPEWVIGANGQFKYLAGHADATHASAGQDGHDSKPDMMVGDNSLYVGSSRISYNRATHEVTLHKLKTNQLPKYFTDLGYNSSNLPSTYTPATMTVQRYMALARELASNDDIGVRTVLPAANTTDWEVCELAGVPSDADVAAKQDALSAAQLSVVNKTFGTVASNSASTICTSDEIKTYVDANAGGGSSGTSYTFFPQTGNASQLADDVQFVHVGKTANANQGGGLFKFILPEFSSNAPDTHTFWIFAYNPIGETGGTIQLEHVTGQDFNNSADDQEYIDFYGDKCLLTRPGRNVYAITYYNNTQKWYVRRVGLDSAEQESHFTMHFANDESNYPQGSPYQCPSGKMRIDLIYGDGDDFSDVSQGVHFYLPVQPRDGCLVCAECTQNKTTSTPAHTLNMRWKQISGLPTTRKLNYVSGNTFTSITPPTTTYGTAQAVQCYGGKTRREFWRYRQSGDFWVHSRDSN